MWREPGPEADAPAMGEVMRQYWQCTKCQAMRKVKPELAAHYSGPKLCVGTWEPVRYIPQVWRMR